MTNPRPNPGSPEAIAMSCTCPRLDNSHGAGIYGGIKDKNGNPMFWISEDCPLHSMPKQPADTANKDD